MSAYWIAEPTVEEDSVQAEPPDSRFVRWRIPPSFRLAPDFSTDPSISSTAQMQDLSILAGQSATKTAIKRLVELRRLRNLLEVFSESGLSYSIDQSNRISSISATAGAAFLRLLPDTIALPKIAPDGEGSLLAVWEDETRRDILIVEGWQLHLVMNAGRPNSEYVENRPFDEDELPEDILHAMAR